MTHFTESILWTPAAVIGSSRVQMPL